MTQKKLDIYNENLNINGFFNYSLTYSFILRSYFKNYNINKLEVNWLYVSPPPDCLRQSGGGENSRKFISKTE